MIRYLTIIKLDCLVPSYPPPTDVTAGCIHCRNHEHILVICPIKRNIWLQTLGHFFPELSINTDQILNTTLPLDFRFWTTKSTIASSILYSCAVGCILLGIWKSHWQNFFGIYE